jgi:hypothetical protein
MTGAYIAVSAVFAMHHRFPFAIGRSRVKLLDIIGTGGMTMALARPLHLALVCAAFAFVAAVVLGAL